MKISGLTVVGLFLVLAGLTACEDDGIVSADACTSGEKSLVDEGTTMSPGGECVACHTREREGPIYSFAGTVYQDLHDEDDCTGVPKALITLTDADGVEEVLESNSVGNFYTKKNLKTPLTVSVEYEGAVAKMATVVETADCNSCHTASGAEGAAGRIVIP